MQCNPDHPQMEGPRRHVMAAFAASLDEFDALYRALARVTLRERGGELG